MKVDPMKPDLKPPGTKHLKVNCDMLLSISAFKLNLRRYCKGYTDVDRRASCGYSGAKVRRCRLTLSNSR